MHDFNKKLAAAGAAAALMAVIGVAWAQAPLPDDPADTPTAAAGDTGGAHILRFRDQGNSPETDPAAHLLLIKHQEVVPVAQTTTTTTTVAQATTTNDNVATTMPAASDTSNTNTSTTDTTAAAPVVDNGPALAPKADRN